MPHVTRYSVMPIPAVAAREVSFVAGGVRVGVAYHLLTDAVAAAARLEAASGDADFRDFSFGNPARFYTRLNPDFFAGTRVEAEVTALLEEPA